MSQFILSYYCWSLSHFIIIANSQHNNQPNVTLTHSPAILPSRLTSHLIKAHLQPFKPLSEQNQPNHRTQIRWTDQKVKKDINLIKDLVPRFTHIQLRLRARKRRPRHRDHKDEIGRLLFSGYWGATRRHSRGIVIRRRHKEKQAQCSARLTDLLPGHRIKQVPGGQTLMF